MTVQFLNAADYPTGFFFSLAGWSLTTGSAPARILLSNGQNTFACQTTGTLCVFYNNTAITTPVARVGFIVPNITLGSQKGAALVDGVTGNGYALIHNSGNPGTLEIRTITASVLDGTPLASVVPALGVQGDQFDMYRNQSTGEMLCYQNGTLVLSHTDVSIPNALHPAWMSMGSTALVVSLIYEDIGGSVTSLTDPLVTGSPLTLVTAGFTTITSISGGGMSAAGVSFSAGTTTATWPAISGSIAPTVALPASNVTISVSDGGTPVTVQRNINLAAGWANVQFGTQIDEPDYLLSEIPIVAGYYAYYETNQPVVGDVVIYPDGSVYTDAGGDVTLFLHKLGDDDSIAEYVVTALAGTRAITLGNLSRDPRTGKLWSYADPNWPEGFLVEYDFARGQQWVNKDGWTWSGAARTLVAEDGTGEVGARYQYAGGNDPFGDGAAAPEQYFTMPENSEFWFKRRIFIPANYSHREMLRLTIGDTTGWEVGDLIHGTNPAYTGVVQYVSATKLSVKNAVGASLNGSWVGSVTNTTKGLTATCTERWLWAGNNKFQVFYCDGYSATGDSPTYSIQLWPRRLSDSDWGHGSDISVQCGVNDITTGNRIVTQSPKTAMILPVDYGKWMDVVFYCKMSSAAGVQDGIFAVWKKVDGESEYTKIQDYRLLDSGERPGSGSFRAGYVWGWANSGYEDPTLFIESKYMLSTTAIDGCIL